MTSGSGEGSPESARAARPRPFSPLRGTRRYRAGTPPRHNVRMATTRERGEERTEFEIPIVTYQVPGPVGTGPMWIARSVATGHVGQGRTETGAIEGLLLVIETLLASAVEEGTSPAAWFALQRPSVEYQLRFQAAERSGAVERVPTPSRRGRFPLRPRKAYCGS